MILKNKKIFVFGGTGLIGSSIIKKINQNGAKIVNIDINLNKQKSIKNHFLDLKNKEKLDINLKSLIKKFGIPDSVIFCSYPTTDKYSKLDRNTKLYADFTRNIDYQLSNICWAANKLAQSMKAKKKTNILLISSIYGLVGQNLEMYKGTTMRENISYPIIKGGIIGFTKQLASIYGKYNLRVNCLCPGAVKGHVKNTTTNQPKKFIKKFSNQVPLKRLADPDEISNVANFLVSDFASYMTGSVIVVDGGWTSI